MQNYCNSQSLKKNLRLAHRWSRTRLLRGQVFSVGLGRLGNLPCKLSGEWCQLELNGLPVVFHGLEAEPILESDILGLAPIAATAIVET